MFKVLEIIKQKGAHPQLKTSAKILYVFFSVVGSFYLGLLVYSLAPSLPENDRYDPNYYDAVKMYTRPL